MQNQARELSQAHLIPGPQLFVLRRAMKPVCVCVRACVCVCTHGLCPVYLCVYDVYGIYMCMHICCVICVYCVFMCLCRVYARDRTWVWGCM